MKIRLPISSGIRVPTVDDWHPNFPGDCVRVSSYARPEESWWRICVWGADDTGMERDFDSVEKFEAALRRLPSVIAMADLLAAGFQWA